MADDLLDRVRATGLLGAGADVVVLLSGGRDSVCLLDVAVALECSVRALHVNYGLREEADEDEAHCRALCERLGVALAVHRAARPGDGPGNLQAWARDVRYAAATEAAGEGLVAVGHTASDQAETVLYRLAASPGRRALLGMRPRSGRLVRPLLAVTREETGAWCRARGLAWRDDATNASGDFARGRVRHGLLAALEAVDGRAAANVVRTAAAAARGGRGPRRRRRHDAGRTRPDRRCCTSPTCPRRSRGSSCAGSPRPRPAACAPAPPRAWTTSSRSARTAPSTSATARGRWCKPVLRFERTPPLRRLRSGRVLRDQARGSGELRLRRRGRH